MKTSTLSLLLLAAPLAACSSAPASISNVPGGALTVHAAIADYAPTGGPAIITLTTDSDACATQKANGNPPPSTRFLELDVGHEDGGALVGTYSLSDSSVLAQAVYYAYDDKGEFGDQWNGYDSGTIDISDSTATSLRGSFDLTLTQVTDSGSGPSRDVHGSFDAAYCQAPMLPTD